MRETENCRTLSRGLDILRLIAESPEPLTSTEIARKLGIHQSSASRALGVLVNSGYVCKPTYHSFAADYGVLVLAGTAGQRFALTVKLRPAVEKICARVPELLVTVATLWRGELLYFLRLRKDQEPMPSIAGGYPLHLSAISLRLLMDVSHKEALAVLEQSRRQYGWERPTKTVPATAAACLQYARRNLTRDCLLLRNYQHKDQWSISIPLDPPGHPRSVLVISGPAGTIAEDHALLLLHEGRRELYASLGAAGQD